MGHDREFESDVAGIMRDLAPMVLSWPKAEAQRASYRFLSLNCLQGHANLVKALGSLPGALDGPERDTFLEVLQALHAIGHWASELAGVKLNQVPPCLTRNGTADALHSAIWSARVTFTASLRMALRIGPIDAGIISQAEWLDQALAYLETAITQDWQVA